MRRPSRRAVRLSLNWMAPAPLLEHDPPRKRSPAAGDGGADHSQADAVDNTADPDEAQGARAGEA